MTYNKKVLLRERKRHTDRSVSSIPSVVLYQGGTPCWRGIPTAAYQVFHVLSCTGGYPLLEGGMLVHPNGGYPLLGGTPSQVQMRKDTPGYPHLDLARVPPIQGWMGVAPIQDWMGVPPRLDLTGVPSLAEPDWGTPPPHLWTDRRMDRHVSKHNLPLYYVRGR